MRIATTALLIIFAFGAGALFGFSRRPPLGTLPPWMIEKIKERRRDDHPSVTLPLPPPPPLPEEEEYDPVVIDDEDEDGG